MKLKIYVPREVEVPDELLGELARGARENGRIVIDPYGVPMESILEEARERGVLDLPAEFHCDLDEPLIKEGKPV